MSKCQMKKGFCEFILWGDIDVLDEFVNGLDAVEREALIRYLEEKYDKR